MLAAAAAKEREREPEKREMSVWKSSPNDRDDDIPEVARAAKKRARERAARPWRLTRWTNEKEREIPSRLDARAQ